MSYNEIITLQLGNYANFVGSYFWNLQDSANKAEPDRLADIFFQETTRTQRKIPRLICCDLKGHSLGWSSPPKENGDSQHSASLEESVTGFHVCDMWNQGSSTRALSGSTKPEVGKKSTKTPSTWVNTLQVPLSSKSYVEVKDYHHKSTSAPFENYEQGVDICRPKSSGCSILEELEETIRTFSEECNQLQGFQLLVDSNSGFSGVAGVVAELLGTEYGGKSRFCWQLFAPEDSHLQQLGKVAPTGPQAQKLHFLRAYNWCRSFVMSHEFVTCALPLGCTSWDALRTHLPTLTKENRIPASHKLNALALDTFAVPLCYSQMQETMWCMEENLLHGVSTGVKVALPDLGLGIPVVNGGNISLAGYLHSLPNIGALFKPANPFSFTLDYNVSNGVSKQIHSQLCVLRGVSDSQIVMSHERELAFNLRNVTSAAKVLELYCAEQTESIGRCRTYSLPAPVSLDHMNNLDDETLFHFPELPQGAMSMRVATPVAQMHHAWMQTLDVLKDRAFRALLPVLLPELEWDDVAESLERYEQLAELYL